MDEANSQTFREKINDLFSFKQTQDKVSEVNADEDIDHEVEKANKTSLSKESNWKEKVLTGPEEELRNNQCEDDVFKDEVIKVKMINKRELGKIMIKYCGHEGTRGTEQSRSLRKLLQTCINKIEHYGDKVWANAEIAVYDADDNTFRIISGHGKHKFIVSDKNGIPEINKMSKKGIIIQEEEQTICTVM